MLFYTAVINSNQLFDKKYHPDEVTAMIDKVTFAWEVLSEEDRDYIQGCQSAINDLISWGDPSTWEKDV